MLLPTRPREEGALLCRFIAHCHGEIHRRLMGELLQAFGAVPCCLTGVDALLGHRPDSKRMDAAWMGARTEDLITMI